jgi:ubiquinol-cytochrome c reductase cytochrome b subunit
MPAEGIYVILSRVATAYYFFHFLILFPLLPYIEKTKPLPISISQPVLSGAATAATSATREKK